MKDNSKAARQRRHDQAIERQSEYDALSIEQKVARAESRRGNSKRELAGLRALLDD